MDDTGLKVLVNHEEQYSLWPDYLDAPAGWHDTGVSGAREQCLAYVKEVWTDMRPLSLRQKMAESAHVANAAAAGSAVTRQATAAEPDHVDG